VRVARSAHLDRERRQEQTIITCRAWSSAVWEGRVAQGMVRHGSEHLEATSWCPLTAWPRTSIEALSIGELPFDSRPSNARARRCNQTSWMINSQFHL